MAILPIHQLDKSPVLRKKAKKVSSIDSSIQRLIDNMIETMQSANGVGLAAPQIGVPLRVIVVQIPEEEPFALINPQITRRSGARELTEGCLSIPGFYGEVKRAEAVTAKGLDRQGREVRIKATGLMAEVLEHEIDHLNGTLYVDHLEGPDKLHKVEKEKEEGTEI